MGRYQKTHNGERAERAPLILAWCLSEEELGVVMFPSDERPSSPPSVALRVFVSLSPIDFLV